MSMKPSHGREIWRRDEDETRTICEQRAQEAQRRKIGDTSHTAQSQSRRMTDESGARVDRIKELRVY